MTTSNDQPSASRPEYLERAIAPYADDAEKYSALWRRTTTQESWVHLLDLFHPAPCRLIDVACGDGKDAVFYEGLGYAVTAVDPSAALRDLAKRLAPETSKIAWIDDAFPSLGEIARGAYRMATVSAGFVHVMPHDQKPSLQSLYALLESGGRCAISLRDGPLETERLKFATNTDHFIDWAKEVGFTLVRAVRQRLDLHGRADIFWNYLMLEKP